MYYELKSVETTVHSFILSDIEAREIGLFIINNTKGNLPPAVLDFIALIGNRNVK
jgi:hypothetical protein